MFAERRFRDGGLGNALIRDGNGARSFETLLRYRAAGMAEFWRALKTLKALQAEARTLLAAETGRALAAQPIEQVADAPREQRKRSSPAPVAYHQKPDEPERAAPRPPLAHRVQPDEPERAAAPRLEYVLAEPPASARALHEPAAPWPPNEPESAGGPPAPPCEPGSHAGPNAPESGAAPHAPAPSPRRLMPNEPARASCLAPGEPESPGSKRPARQ